MLRKLVPALALAALAYGQKVHVQFDESIDFSKYKTYVLETGSVRSPHQALDNTLVEKKIRNAITTRLSAKGMQQVESQGDVNVNYRLGSKDRRESDRVPAGRRGLGSRKVVYRVTDATLVITMRDPGMKDLVWQATCTDTGRDVQKLEEHINKDVEKAFKEYPPKHKK